MVNIGRNDPRHGRHRTTLRRNRRSIPQVGYGEDYGVIFQCWYCGWDCRTDRDPFGGAPAGSNTVQDGADGTAGDANPPIPTSGQPLTFQLNNWPSTAVRSTMLLAKGDGSAQQINFIHEFFSTACPGCGTQVWKS